MARPSWYRKSGWLALGACLAAVALVWLGYRAIVEWEHAAAMVAAKRAESAVDLLVAALGRDMRGAQLLMLPAVDGSANAPPTNVDLLDPITSGLARYAYAAAYFSWRTPDPAAVVFYSRTERRPPWLVGRSPATTVPIELTSEPEVAARLVERVTQDVLAGHRFSVFTFGVDGRRYQVVAALSYDDPRWQRPPAVLGFLVDLDWVRREYFAGLVAEVARIESPDRDLLFAILDDRREVVAGRDLARPGSPAERRSFRLAFFDPQVVAVDPPADLALASWTAAVDASGDATLAAAGRGARRTLGVAAAMALVLGVGLVLSLRAVHASAALAELRADFVSAVTHELKTPIANMRAINETLAAGRGDAEMTRDYATMGRREAARLTRLVDNLLAYARITDVTDAYLMVPVALESIVDRCLQEFAALLTDGHFDVHIECPEDVPMVLGDATALGLMLNNLVDNAIRYSTTSRHLTVRVHQAGAWIVLSVIDRGIGIPGEDLGRVTGRFVRGRNATTGGSGLGLSIVDRIVTDHHGHLEITSVAGAGTTVTVSLPVVRS